MRLTLLTLPLLSATTFSGLVIAEDSPERSPELKVLDHIANQEDPKHYWYSDDR